MVIPLRQHIGAPCTPLVKPGDTVGLGQKLGDGEGLCVPVHASVSGLVTAVEPRPHPGGGQVLSVVIENDYQDTPASALEPHLDLSGLTKEEIVAAAKAAHVHHFVQTLANGYDMELNEEASNVSQGQKQLLTIARAILADPKILILDEATSSVDTRTEVRIQKAMDNLMRGRTSFIIAHRLSTIRDADSILVMRDGDIVEQGSHEELLAKGGFYAQLYNSQFENTEEAG